MRSIAIGKFLICLAASAMLISAAEAATISPGDLVVVRAGTGAAALAATGTATFLDEYTVGGTSVQSIALPTTGSGSQQALTLSGTSTSEGFLALSANGQYLTVGGYNAAPGATTNGANNNRVAGRVDLAGNVDTSTNLQDASTTGNIRSVVSNDGTQFWAGTSGGGVRYATFGSAAASTQLNTAAPTNMRVVNINSGQLYVSSASGTFQGVGTVGTGLPTTSGQTPTLLNGFPTVAGPSNYDYVFADANTLYVADDRSTGSGGGLQKWVQSGGTWTLAYTLSTNLTAGLRGLAGTTDGLGNEILYATTGDAITTVSGNKLVAITDVISNTTLPVHSFATLATAAGNTAFRGVELIPGVVVPEPTAMALMLLSSISLLVIRGRAGR